ncbi:MAG: AbrB/MazE/SpoVT family DNA-binding domain-containing protein [Patescibacteria group bacterium]|nr:AbrB/MazE/SpoVT family DNA-binding domain-containing protein [Patescibacteria group bacterium]MDD4304564.1 AbrB/MazE/SpoVT family DNA-binding domain-containing protein [Patescibacteria group bacterium]MDD4695751.1 AbrB/MazE/SpoVT family DNA-binding domain-containing protein [Patescibacteria group bacterium]
MIKQKEEKQGQFYGTTTLGEKGQIVIPSEARNRLNIKKGEKMLVFGMNSEMLVFAKLENLAKIEKHLAKQLETIHKIKTEKI